MLIWKSDLSDKIKHSFFLVAVISIQLYGYTMWTLTKCMEKKLDCNYTRMLRAILDKYWRQYSTKQWLYGHLPPITKNIQIRRIRHMGHCWRSKEKLISDILPLTHPHRDEQRQDDQLEPIDGNSVPTLKNLYNTVMNDHLGTTSTRSKWLTKQNFNNDKNQKWDVLFWKVISVTLQNPSDWKLNFLDG